MLILYFICCFCESKLKLHLCRARDYTFRCFATGAIAMLMRPLHYYVFQPMTLLLRNRHKRHLSSPQSNQSLLVCDCIAPLVKHLEIVVRTYFQLQFIPYNSQLTFLAAPYPIYSHSNSYTSVHSASSSSIHPSSASGHQRPPMAPRTSSATSISLSWGITALPCLPKPQGRQA